jgi:hypothetical protein
MYRGKINLWVEDAVTRVYLRECWAQDPDVLFLTAGGSESIRGVMEDASQRGFGNVFGFMDRDFRQANVERWLNLQSQLRTFVPAVHECENYLLDEHALAGCSLNTGGRPAADIAQRLQQRAGELVWWMSCRKVIADLRDKFFADFPSHPKCPKIINAQDAEQYILSHQWFQQLLAKTNAAVHLGEIGHRISDAHIHMDAHLKSGQWKVAFSGKELFHHIRDWVNSRPPPHADPSERDEDLAKAVAQWQVQNGQVPQEVAALRQGLRQKAGLP